ncbi:MAG TPA: helix-turn-helix domain-containing protein [Planctomycetaceae bacterium]|nr:helix-turn-helix domain-containing protein [Planctomycetaceae bacterium]
MDEDGGVEAAGEDGKRFHRRTSQLSCKLSHERLRLVRHWRTTVRRRLGKSQNEVARMIGVSVATLQNWEQGRRRPEGPARALLKVAAMNPEAVAAALAE